MSTTCMPKSGEPRMRESRLVSTLARRLRAMTFVVLPLIASDAARSRRRKNDRNNDK